MKKNRAYMIYALITVFIWSTAFLFTQYAQESFSSQSIGFLRYLAASVALIVIMAVKKTGLPKLKDVPKFLMAGFVGFALYVTAFNKSVETINGATCSVIGQFIPILTAVFSCVILHEKISLKGWLCIALAFAGILVLTLWNGALSIRPGVLWMLAASVALSTYNLLQRMFVKDYTPFQVTAYCILGGTLFLFFFLPGTIPEIAGASLVSWGAVVYLGLFGGALAYVFWAKAFSMADRTSDVSNFMFATPLITSLVGFVAKGEVPGPETVIGGILIIGGMILFQLEKQRNEKKKEENG